MNTIQTFISSLSSTDWFNVQKSYYYQASESSPRINTTGPIKVANTVKDNYSCKKNLGDDKVTKVISNQLMNKKLPYDENGLYLVLTSSDVKEGAFCDSYCGYHSYFDYNSKRIIYAFIGNALSMCRQSCIGRNLKVSPNKDVGIDGMISVIAHEIAEAMSDPELNTWADSDGEENADKW